VKYPALTIVAAVALSVGCTRSSGSGALIITSPEGRSVSLTEKYPGKKFVVAFHRGHW
jgi:hypothetical protein